VIAAVAAAELPAAPVATHRPPAGSRRGPFLPTQAGLLRSLWCGLLANIRAPSGDIRLPCCPRLPPRPAHDTIQANVLHDHPFLDEPRALSGRLIPRAPDHLTRITRRSPPPRAPLFTVKGRGDTSPTHTPHPQPHGCRGLIFFGEPVGGPIRPSVTPTPLLENHAAGFPGVFRSHATTGTSCCARFEGEGQADVLRLGNPGIRWFDGAIGSLLRVADGSRHWGGAARSSPSTILLNIIQMVDKTWACPRTCK
jgi:hypothetical protein